MGTLSRLRYPPRRTNFKGEPRKVGVELEFAAVNAATVAARIVDLYGGEAEKLDSHRYRIRGTKFGEFVAELDTQYAHRSPQENPTDPSGAGTGPAGAFSSFFEGFGDAMRQFYGDVGSLVIPYEVVCPPIAVEDLAELERMVIALREAGAKGTRDNIFHAFGAQLNPDIAEVDPGWILAVLKAEILLSDWLRSILSIDVARRLLAFADPFHPEYARKVLAPSYWPPMDQLIDDYLWYNPTRNRELDMLPLFAWLDEPRVRKRVSDKLVKARPTFHYRLPDANIGEPNWSLTLEWNRWCVVERIAEDREILAEMGAAYIANADSFLPEDWALRCTEWLALRL